MNEDLWRYFLNGAEALVADETNARWEDLFGCPGTGVSYIFYEYYFVKIDM